MTALQSLFQEQGQMPQLKNSLISKYPHISMNSEIQSGWPCIKGTRVRALDVFRAMVKGYSTEKIIMQFKEMDVHLSPKQIHQAFYFTLEWMNTLNARKGNETTR